MSDKTNAKRIEREQARVNELLDLLRESPTMLYAEVLSTLSKQWGVSTDTVKHVFQFVQRKKLVKKQAYWSVK